MLASVIGLFFTLSASAVSVSWDSCHASSDCVKSFGTCSSVVSVNKEFVVQHKEAVAKEALSAKCAQPDAERAKADELKVPVCVKSLCKLQAPKA